MTSNTTLVSICVAGAVLLFFASRIREWLSRKLPQGSLSRLEYSLREQVVSTPYTLAFLLIIYGAWNLLVYYRR